ncbi:endopeptidase La [Desulfohalovibrio reitneri]|uniref:endopeptidase La n=1 Tax=Desulfohalovibrio reitneri TaxID=1307759 RepID=UPI0004A7477C|nr:endopeptidase La [Desulfohalovibrio reitneri]
MSTLFSGLRGQSEEEKQTLPMMSLREVVMFPKSIVPLFVGREASIKAIEHALAHHDKKIFLVTQKNPEKERPEGEDLYPVGTVSKILQLLRLPDGTIKVLFEGEQRAGWDNDSFETPAEGEFPMVAVNPLEDLERESGEADALVRATHESLEQYAKVNKKVAQETLTAMSSLNQPGRLADSLMPHLKVEFDKKQGVLEELDPVKRLEEAYRFLETEIEIASLERKIKGRVKNQMEQNQRDYYLNEQLKAIHKEMGREDDPAEEAEELEKRMQEKNMPEEAREKGMRELKKLKQIPPSSAEYTVVRNYVDWILDLPWNDVKPVEIDIDKARTILDEDHYGLEKPKDRILEYLAVSALVDKLKGPILCFVGPPGVGKTSLAKSIARATDRPFVRLSLGGVRDEAEIRGHRRTYVGALPGKIIQSLKRVEYNNPVFILDEIDKMSMDFRGDPSSALLEVLDPEQNDTFADHYLDLDYDLSKVFFITTANTLHSIPAPLQDRMEVIQLPGYLETEKRNIAEKFLLPKQLEQHGLEEENLELPDEAVTELIRRYTREAGVRNLEREIASLCRKSAMRIVESKAGDREDVERVEIGPDDLQDFLGPPKHRYGKKEEKPQVGLTNGLAFTEHGGDLLMVEVVLMPGSGKIETTGKLGDVMQESAKAALSYVRSRSDLFGLRPEFHKEIDIHIHVPEGAIPKDGPSAGITLATALVSALLNRPVREDLAMTGEITLRGRVLPIGGLRQKLLAAHRGLIKRVLIPAENEKDLEEVPEEIKNDLEIIPVEHMDEVLRLALVDGEGQPFLRDCQDLAPLAASLLKEESGEEQKQQNMH